MEHDINLNIHYTAPDDIWESWYALLKYGKSLTKKYFVCRIKIIRDQKYFEKTE